MNDERPSLVQRFPALRRLERGSRRRRVPFVQQLHMADCGAASLAMVLRFHGKEVPLDDVRRGDDPDSRLTDVIDAATRSSEAHTRLWRFDVILPEGVSPEAKGKACGLCEDLFGRDNCCPGRANWPVAGREQLARRNAERAYRDAHDTPPTTDIVEQLVTAEHKDGFKPIFKNDFLELVKDYPPSSLFSA